ncbi:MAG: ABC transporter substrate-binding protein [Acetobacteraceae bacterium]|nr:ABC transporter substrate-binding protein [Acetobacteraceae bacterium]
MKRRQFLAGTAASAVGAGLARPALSQGAARVLKFVPQADLASPDPVWTTTVVAANHGFMVWDTLFGIDGSLTPKLQMLGGYDLSDDKLTWTMKLRDGLLFHDGEPVRSTDCIASIKRWSQRDGFGQRMMTQMGEMKAVDDRTFTIRLTKPYPVLPYALGEEPCFIMPERIARTDAFTQIKEFIGSGPYRFLPDQWVSGSGAAWARFDQYVPRQEPPDLFSGGKVANFDRVQWITMPDPATKAAALQSGEVDWVEQPLIDLIPMLRKSDGVTVETLDPVGVVAIIAFNHTQPPFDNRKLLQALLPAVDQQEFMSAVVGDQMDLARTGVGFFTLGTPLANTAGLEALTGPRDVAQAKKLIADSGYKGEPIVLMSPSDQPANQALAQVTQGLYQKLGLNVQYASMDWGTLVSRRANHAPSSQGGWNSFCTTWTGLTLANPGGAVPLRGNGQAAWFGWPTDPQMEALRDKWFDAPDLAAQRAVAEDVQRLAFQDLPFIPTGQYFQPTAHRSNLSGFLKSPLSLFWSVKRS